MKKILLVFLSIIFILSCKASSSNPLDTKYSGKYVSSKPINGSTDSYLVVEMLGDGGFQLYYSSDENGTSTDATKKNTITGNDIRGKDPSYTFQTGMMAGSLQIISDKALKITVTFNSESTILKDVLCYQKNN